MRQNCRENMLTHEAVAVVVQSPKAIVDVAVEVSPLISVPVANHNVVCDPEQTSFSAARVPGTRR